MISLELKTPEKKTWVTCEPQPDMGCHSVAILFEGDDERYGGLEFTDWREALNFFVRSDALASYGSNDLLAHILYEMTFVAYSNDEILVERDKLFKSIDEATAEGDEVMAEGDEKGRISLEELVEKLGIAMTTEEDVLKERDQLILEFAAAHNLSSIEEIDKAIRGFELSCTNPLVERWIDVHAMLRVAK